MLGNPAVEATLSPSVLALSTNEAGVGWSLETIASPPSNWRASRDKPWFRRSAKKPTALSAATASITATTSRRSSPARKSRAIWRQARCHSETRDVLDMWGDGDAGMRSPREAFTLPEAPAAGLARGLLNTACKSAER